MRSLPTHVPLQYNRANLSWASVTPFVETPDPHRDRYAPPIVTETKEVDYSSRTALTWPSWPGREVTRARPSLVSISAPLVTMFRRT